MFNSLSTIASRTLALVACVAPFASAQEVDIMVQREGNKVVSGLADIGGGNYTIPHQVYVRNLLTNFRALNPGFFALGENNPQLSADPLPAGVELHFDFVPMTVDLTFSNLFYWDGLDDDTNGLNADDVEFVRPDNAVFKMFDGDYTADASDQLVAGGAIGTTAFDGSLHVHPDYRVETLDFTTPDQGVYLVSMQLRMAGLETSDPIFLAMRTSTLGSDALLAAQQWITANLDMLTSPPTLAGDYNGDGLVNLADYTVWRNTLGSTTDLAANGDNAGASENVIDAADYLVWKTNFGNSLSSPALVVAGSSVPEPGSSILFFTFGFVVLGHRLLRKTA